MAAPAAAPAFTIQDAIIGINQKYDEAKTANKRNEDGTLKIKASSGLLVWKYGEKEIQLLMGKKTDTGAFVTFAGGVEEIDFNRTDTLPAVIATACREAEEETRNLIKFDVALQAINSASTWCIKNESWPHFCAPVFAVNFNDLDISGFNTDSSTEQKPELSELKWLSLTGVLNAQDARAAELESKKEEFAKDTMLSEDDRKKALSSLKDKHIKLASGDEVAAYVGRTVGAAKGKFLELQAAYQRSAA